MICNACVRACVHACSHKFSPFISHQFSNLKSSSSFVHTEKPNVKTSKVILKMIWLLQVSIWWLHFGWVECKFLCARLNILYICYLMHEITTRPFFFTLFSKMKNRLHNILSEWLALVINFSLWCLTTMTTMMLMEVVIPRCMQCRFFLVRGGGGGGDVSTAENIHVFVRLTHKFATYLHTQRYSTREENEWALEWINHFIPVPIPNSCLFAFNLITISLPRFFLHSCVFMCLFRCNGLLYMLRIVHTRTDLLHRKNMKRKQQRQKHVVICNNDFVCELHVHQTNKQTNKRRQRWWCADVDDDDDDDTTK